MVICQRMHFYPLSQLEVTLITIFKIKKSIIFNDMPIHDWMMM